MSWPTRLDGLLMLRLVFEGVVLRVHGNLVVVNVGRPEFRTAGKGVATARQEIAVASRAL